MSNPEWSFSWQNPAHFRYQRHLNNHFYAKNTTTDIAWTCCIWSAATHIHWYTSTIISIVSHVTLLHCNVISQIHKWQLNFWQKSKLNQMTHYCLRTCFDAHTVQFNAFNLPFVLFGLFSRFQYNNTVCVHVNSNLHVSSYKYIHHFVGKFPSICSIDSYIFHDF